MAREFDALLFMGNEAASNACQSLHDRLEHAFTQLSAWQQGGRVDREDTDHLDDLVKDFAAALLGREITLGRKLPYPGKLTHVPCTNPSCSSRRRHHEDDEPRGVPNMVPVADDHVGVHYCSIECACYDGAYSVTKGWLVDPALPRQEEVPSLRC